MTSTPTPTLSKAYLSLSPIPKVCVFILLLVVSFIAGIRLTTPLADYVLSGIQWVFQYYPEDPDPEFVLAWIVTDLLFAVALLVIIYRSLGVHISSFLLRLSGAYLILVLATFVFSFVYFWLFWEGIIG